MTERQFERVFSRAQELQYVDASKKDIEKGEALLAAYSENRVIAEGTVTHLALVLNCVSMHIDGEYDMYHLANFRNYCLGDVKLLPDKKAKPKKRKK